MSAEDAAYIEKLKAKGLQITLPQLPLCCDRTFHYLPYRFDSGLEKEYFANSLSNMDVIKEKNLEFYFNGDDALTCFKIDCYRRCHDKWMRIDRYVPDFLVISRSADGAVRRVLIIETKGKGFVLNFEDKRRFMEEVFLKKNEEKFGYRRFDFLYLEESLGKEMRDEMTIKKINEFFKD